MHSQKHIKVIFPLVQDEDGYPPASAEALWVLVENNVYYVDNIPIFVRGISLGDSINITVEDTRYYFKSVKNYCGNNTIRIWVSDIEKKANIILELHEFQCDTETISSFPNLIAVNIPIRENYKKIRNYLTQGAHTGIFDYEEGSVSW